MKSYRKLFSQQTVLLMSLSVVMATIFSTLFMFLFTVDRRNVGDFLGNVKAASNVKALIFVLGPVCPTGMTQIDSSVNNRFIRIRGGVGVATDNTPAGLAPALGGSATIDVTQMPSHTHQWYWGQGGLGATMSGASTQVLTTAAPYPATHIGATGGGQPYWQPYLDLIACVWEN